jgi:iron complex outermembrane receptor protein
MAQRVVWMVGIVGLVSIQPGVAAELPTGSPTNAAEWNHDRPAKNLKEWLSQTPAPTANPTNPEIVQVIQVRLNRQPNGLLEVVLETADGKLLPVSFREENETLIADIPNATLVLPEGRSVAAKNPAAGIASVTIVPVEPSGIRVTIVGVDTVPTATVVPSDRGLILAIAPNQPEEEVVVTATRTAEPLANVPRAVTIITREQLQQQSGITTNLPDLLGKLVPGLGPPTLQNSTRGLTLRGRQALILIDGIPQNPNSGFATELNVIDPSAIERIEVVRGPSAIYGDGATGGIINFITRKPGTKPVENILSFTVRNSTQQFTGEGFSLNPQYNLFVKDQKVDLTFGLASNINQSFFDAEGDRIPPNGVNDTNALNLLVKLGYNLDPQQRLQLSYNLYDESRETDFRSNPIVFSIPGLQTARAQRFPVNYAQKPGQTNQVASFNYSHQNLFGSKVNFLAFYRSTELAQVFTDLRGRTFPAFFPLLWQTSLDSEELGVRLQIETPLSPSANLLWGADYGDEENSRPLLISNIPTFVSTGTLDASSTRPQTPFYTLKNLGLFAQFQWDVVPTLRFSGGLRYDTFRYAVDDYELAFAAPGTRFGADDRNSGVSVNAGLVYKLTPQLSLYTSFAQGFSLPDLGTAFSSVLPNVGVRGSDLVEPLKVNNFELGIRGNWKTFQAELAGFFSYSRLGSAIRVNRDGTTELDRAPQRNYGIEASVDWQPVKAWRLGGSLTWNEGENDPTADPRDFIPLSSVQVPPLKAIVYLENQTLPNWRNRLQLLTVGDRDRAFEERVDSFEVKSYTTLDFLSSLKLGQGTLELGVENLLNNQYLPLSSQERTGLTEDRRFAARGRTIFLRYSITF